MVEVAAVERPKEVRVVDSSEWAIRSPFILGAEQAESDNHTGEIRKQRLQQLHQLAYGVLSNTLRAAGNEPADRPEPIHQIQLGFNECINIEESLEKQDIPLIESNADNRWKTAY